MKYYINEEFIRGAIASIISSLFSTLLNNFCVYFIPMHVDILFFINYFIIGNVLSYSLDILLAKQYFDNKKISYSNIRERFIYLMKSYFSASFVKFLVTVFIDLILKYSIFKTMVEILSVHGIILPYRDNILLTVIPIFTFIMFINNLRFNWAYKNDSDYITELIVLTWFALSIIIFFK